MMVEIFEIGATVLVESPSLRIRSCCGRFVIYLRNLDPLSVSNSSYLVFVQKLKNVRICLFCNNRNSQSSFPQLHNVGNIGIVRACGTFAFKFKFKMYFHVLTLVYQSF